MEVHSQSRRIVYYPLEKDEIIERNLDDYISYLRHNSKSDGKRHHWIYKNNVCEFFGIHNTTYMTEDSDYPHVDCHYTEKENLLKELIDADLLEPKSSTTFYIPKDLLNKDFQGTQIDKDLQDTQTALHIIKNCKYPNLWHSEFGQLIRQTCVLSGSGFVAWHTNKFYPDATVDKLKELGWAKFYELNKGNFEKKQEYFRNLKSNETVCTK